MPGNRLKSFIQSLRHLRRVINTVTFKKYNFIEIALIWAKRKLSRFQFLVVSGIIVGFLGGLAGILLKLLVHAIQFYLHEDLPIGTRLILYGTLPILGIILTTLVGKYFYKNKEDVKLGNVLNDIAHHGSNIDKKQIHMQVIQSAITIGLGGSAGLETPSAITGAAIGSNFAKRFRLGYKEKTLLLAGGASAGIAAAFNAPIAGIMFSFEMLLTGVVFSDFIPLVISAMCGSIITRLLLSDSILFNVSSRSHFEYNNLIYYLFLAALAGFYSRYYILINGKIKSFLGKFRYGSLKRAIIGGVLLSILCMAFPALFAEGYINLQMLEKGKMAYVVYNEVANLFSQPSIILLFALILSTLFKPIATSATLNSGGVGGNFAPSLIAGGLLGYTFGFALSLLGFPHVPILNLMLVGMAGVLSGVLYAPLTGIFLIAESSYGYDLFIPLMIVTVTSFLINKYFSAYNPDYADLVKKGKIFTTRQDSNLLCQIQLEECIETDNVTILNTAKIEEINAKFQESTKTVLAVVDNDERFWGIITKTDLVARYKKGESLNDFSAVEIAIHPNNLITQGMTIEEIAKNFEEADVWFLPLINNDHQFIGIISRIKLLKAYRKLLKDYSN